MRSIQAPFTLAMGCIAQAVPNQVGNFAQAVPNKIGNIAQAVPSSSVGNGDGPSSEFDSSRSCRCAVLFTILFGGIVLGIIALQTPKVKPAEKKEEIPEEECPPSTTPITVYRISGRRLGMQKKVDASTQITPWMQKSPLIILTNTDSKKKKKKRLYPEGPSGDDQVPSSSEDQQSSSGETTETGSCSSETSKYDSSKEKIPAKDKSICEICKKQPATCVCEKVHKKEQVITRVKPHKRKIRKTSQTGSARLPSENGLIIHLQSQRDNRRRSKTADDPRQSRGSPHGSLTSSRPRAKKKVRK